MKRKIHELDVRQFNLIEADLLRIKKAIHSFVSDIDEVIDRRLNEINEHLKRPPINAKTTDSKTEDPAS